eukprot:scaffold453554_cov28-Prasinocladus_malaysianus.AAC.1
MSWGAVLSLCVLAILPGGVAPQGPDIPLPKRCHLAAPCTKARCTADPDSNERWVPGGSGIPVQLGVVCLSTSSSNPYGTGGFFSYS